jgi:glutamate 5-kinase
MQARKQWIADHLQLRGSVTVDAGAVSKLRDEGKSLLPIMSMIAVEGDFSRGEVIAVRDEDGVEIARGLASASAEARLLCRKSSSEIESLLGYSAGPEMMHRDNMVVAGH